MILQLLPKDEEEPLITDKEMEGLGGTGGEPETAEMAEFNDAVTRYRRSQQVYTQPDGNTMSAGSVSKNSPVLQIVPVSLPGGVGRTVEATVTGGKNNLTGRHFKRWNRKDFLWVKLQFVLIGASCEG